MHLTTVIMGALFRHVFSKGISLSLFVLPLISTAQQITVSTYAGTGIEGFVDGNALIQAQFSFPIGVGVCTGNDGAIYVADRGNHAIRKIFNGNVTTLAGNGTQGYADGVGSAAQFAFPNALTVDDTNNVYVCDWLNAVIRKITPAGVVTTFAGTPGVTGYQDGPALQSLFYAPFGITIDNAGNIYVADASETIRKISTSGIVTTYCGQFNSFQGGYLDGAGSIARFNRPSGLAFDNAGNLYVAEESNHTIRKISPSLIVTTIAGVNHIGAGPGSGGYVDGNGLTVAEFNTPSGIVADNSGNLYVADQSNNRIRKIDAQGNVTTFAGSGPVGSGNGGFADGPALSALFNQPYGICHDDSNNLFVADLNNHRIRKISGLPPLCNLQTLFVVTDESCAGAEDGSIDLTVANGTPPLIFSWSNGQTTEDIDTIAAGGYFVIVTDSNGCNISGTAVVNIIPPDSATAANLPPPCSELFISEYIEGTGQNKALEIYNPTDTTLWLNRYFLRVFMNGAPTPLIAQLVGFLPPKQTHVIANPNAGGAIQSVANQTSNKLNFNGDDPIQLIKVKNSFIPNVDSIEGLGQNPHAIFDTLDLDTIDQIGIPGVDPGNQGYPVGSGTTKDATLIRNYSVTYGITDWGCGQKQWKILSQNNVSSLGQHQNKCAAPANNKIFFTFENPDTTIDGLGNNYLEFDIFGYGNNDTTYFRHAEFHFHYDSVAFGIKIKLQGNIFASLGTSLDDSTYYTYRADVSNSVVSVAVYTKPNADTILRTQIATNPIQLVHIKMKIQNCNEQTNIFFVDTTTLTASFSYGINSIVGANYNETHYLNDLNLTNLILCKLNIFSFSPNPITAGTNSILTITGTGFGDTLGKISLTTAAIDDNGPLLREMDSVDYVSWTDTKIEIIIPSTSFNTSNNWIAGTGPFFVITATDFDVSAPLIIPYAVINGPNPSLTKKYKINIANMNNTEGYIFRLDTSIANHPDRKAVAIKAVNDWNCLTKINWSIGPDIINNTMNEDGFSVIAMNSFFHGNPIALTDIHPKFCNDLNNPGQKIAYAKEIDINLTLDFNSLNTNYKWFYDTLFNDVPADSFDFYGALIHELGHGHILDHVNDTSDLMYWGESEGYFPSVQRKYFTYAVQDGGLNVIAAASNLSFDASDCSGVNTHTLKLSICNNPLEIKTFHPLPVEIKVFPNPASYNINIEYKLFTASNFQIRIYDITGRGIYNNIKNNQGKGVYNENINVNSLSNGIYILLVNINNKQYHFKVIKN